MVSRRSRHVLAATAVAVFSLVALAGPPANASTSGGGCQLQGAASFSPPLNNNTQNFSYSFSGALSGCQSSDSTAPTSGTVEAGLTRTLPYNWAYTDSTALASAASAGATTISTAASEGAVPTQAGGTVVQIDPGTSIAETRTVTAVSGSGPFAETLSSPLSFSHSSGAAVTGSHSGSASAIYQQPIATGNGSCGTSTTSGTSVTTWADGTTTVVGYSTTGAAASVTLTGSVLPSVTDTLASYTGPAQAPPAATSTETTTRDAGESALGQLAFQPPDPTACAAAGVTSAAISGVITLGSPQ